MSTQGPGTYLNLSAGGNILPMSFVKLDSSAPDQCLQCGNGDAPIGIAGTWTRYGGGTPANDLEPQGGLEASLGEFPQVASIGCVVPLIAGNGAVWTAGQRLKPDALGYGTPCTGNTDVAGAIALEPSSGTGVHARVLVIVPGWPGNIVGLRDGDALKAQEQESEDLEKERKAKEAEAKEKHEETLTPTQLHAEKSAREEREKEAKQAEEAAKVAQKDIKDKEKSEKTEKAPAHAQPHAHKS